MSDINVLSRTQTIVVNPSSKNVSVINAGPQGPPGGAGSLTEEQAVDAVAAAMVGENNIDVTYDDPAGEISVSDIPDIVIHDWINEGWTPFTERLISNDAGGSASQTISVVSGRGRISNSATPGNVRKGYLRSGTDWMNSEITSLWYGGDYFSSGGTNPATMQGGHIHRAYVDGTGKWRAIVVTNNIFASDVNVVNCNVWNSDLTQPDASQLTLGSNGGQRVYSVEHLQRSPRVISVKRIVFGGSFNEYCIVPRDGHGLTVGMMCTVAVENDGTFNVATAAAIQNVFDGKILMTDAEAGGAVSIKAENGLIVPTSESARRWWPYWVKSRLVGSKCSVKVWRLGDPEPDWSNTNAVNTYDFAAANIPTPNAQYPDEIGQCGLVGAHIRNTRFFEYGYFSARKIA